MLLPLTNLAISTLPPKSITDQSLSSLFFFFPSPICRTLTSHKPKPFKFFVRSSSTDTQTLLPQSAIQRIAEKLRDLGFAEENQNTDSEPDGRSSSAGEIFVPLPKHLPKHRVGHTIDSSWSTPENPVPEPGSGTAITRFHKLRREVKEQKQLENKDLWVKKKEVRVPTLAELSLPKGELRRLRTLGIALDKKLKIGKAGITEGIVNGIHERWRRSEVVKLVCEDLCKMNMKRTHELLERKTGGMVVWRAGWKIVLYRGPNYKYPYFLCDENSANDDLDDTLPDSESKDEKPDNLNHSSSGINGVKSDSSIPPTEIAQAKLVQGVGLPNRVRFQLPGEAQLAEESEELLVGLGPRFTDWWGYDPLPVDADLLPPVVSGYRRPFRLLPYGVNPKLTDDEMTILRRLGRPLPCHFALGRNRNLQGLASSIVKLWEKCEIAKIAVKRGVQNTNSELMAEELKHLTGGTLIARDKEFIVLYRGKDFLPLAVSSAIEERRKYGIHAKKQRIECSLSIKTAEKFKLETADSGKENKHGIHVHKTAFLLEQSKKRPVEASIERTSIKLSMAVEKKVKAEKLLAQLDEASNSQQADIDKEGITEEERYMLRRIGLRMKPFLLLGRRGIFDGTIENMHLHWKYRELVKILSKDKNVEAAHQVAKVLEAESGGILVAVERVNKGYAIIVYRGKNYQRPASLRPQTLLNKRAAMKRSIEAQRRESLKLHVLKLTKNIDDLKLQLARDGAKKSVSMDGSNNTAKDMNNIQSAEPLRQDVELKSDSLSHSVELASSEEMVKAGDSERAHSSPTGLEQAMDVSKNTQQATQQDNIFVCSPPYDEDGTDKVEAESSSGFDGTRTNISLFKDVIFEPKDVSKARSDNFMLSGKPDKGELKPSFPVKVENKLDNMSTRAIQLSNKERLILRKQALKMTKRPVLAVGRSNTVIGVAKTIKEHFKKHPLAIVNVKGRAKGTSVREVVFMLEQATGAVLVSQEPSKVILYRGWGAGDKPYHGDTKNANDMEKAETPLLVSPELLAAIRVECGLEAPKKEEKVS